MAKVAKARADATTTIDPIDLAVGGPDHDMDVSHAMLFHEAAAVLNLHTQAVSMQNTRNVVPVVLDTSSGNYPTTSALPDWTWINVVVKSWFYSTISADLANVVIDHRTTTHEAWIAIEGHFLGNQETHALHLDAKFRAFVQGDLSITNYFKCFKKMADDLAEHVTDRTLVLNVISGINECYKDIDVHFRRGHPFPSFIAVRNELLLEEINMMSHPTTPSTALVATGSSSTRQSTPTNSGAPQSDDSKQKKKQKD
ncbi:uncharacterized protein LOC107303511 [Oryza brachyantha]|uniref:Retrotransposon gag domain-containing protein n=1 Tax=Oryza brachyantha TaxID=4533 RepID=J3LC32_ORYBR|nr:uncharacterized protein LOC107303511 [Oryza brachyantha]